MTSATNISRVFAALLFFFSCSTFGGEKNYDSRYICAYEFEEIADHIIILNEGKSMNPCDVKNGDIIYLDPNYWTHFVSDGLPFIENRFILLTPDSDFPAPGPYRFILDDSRLIAWFAINIVEREGHPKLHFLPLGTKIFANNYQIVNPVLERKEEFAKSHLLYMNFHIPNFPSERQPLYDLFSNAQYCYSTPAKPLEEYALDVVSSKFVLSPRGNGLDCFRTWECLYLGTFPIVRTSALDPLFEGLPVVIVNQWEEINEAFLEEKYEEFKSKSYQWEKLDPDFWIKQILAFQNHSRNRV